MKHWLVLTAAVALIAALSPFKGTDVGKLRPAQWVYLSRQGNVLCLETDTGDRGVGADVAAALKDLRRCAPGEMFLETADYALVSREAQEALPQLRKVLRSGVEVCLAEESPDENTAAYLMTHNPGLTLRGYLSGQGALPVLTSQDGRWKIIGRQK